MIRFLLLVALLFVSATTCFAHVGVVSAVHGNVGLERGKDILSPEAGAGVLSDDILRSKVRSSARVDMDDGSILSIGSNTILRINDYLIREDKSVIRASIELVRGWLRFGVAKLQPGDSTFLFRTPTAVMGVRGTEGILEIVEDEQGVESRIFLEEGAVAIAEGERDGKLIGKIVLLKPGQYASRRQGGKLRVLDHAPPEFLKRMPDSFKTRLKRNSNKLRERGVTPGKIKDKLKNRPKQRLKNKVQKRRQGQVLPLSYIRYAVIRQRVCGPRSPNVFPVYGKSLNRAL